MWYNIEMNNTSKRYRLDNIDWKKIGKGALIVVGGAVLTYSQEIIMEVDFGQFQALAMGVNSIIVNFLRKWLANN